MWLRTIGATVGGVACVVHGMALLHPRLPADASPVAGWAFALAGVVLLTLVASHVMTSWRGESINASRRGEPSAPAAEPEAGLPEARVVRP